MSLDMSEDDQAFLPDDTYCKHFERLDKRRFNRLFSRVAAIRAAGNEEADEYPDIFDYTHHPITVFKQSHDDYSVNTQPVHEDEILSEFDPTRLKNFTVVIEGPVGTGKSELCAYLTHKLHQEPRNRPVLRVDKDSDLLTMLTETIPEFYEDHIGESLDVSGNLQSLAESLESNPEVVAGLVVNKALNTLDRDYDINVPPEKKEGLEEFTLGRLNELVERRERDIDRDEDEREGFRFVSKQDYDSAHFESLHVFGNQDLEKEPYELLNDELWNALLEEFDSPPLKKLLMKVGQAFDTRPVCVFEDFSIAAVQAEKLRNYMERDNDRDNWDFIIAGTTDFTRELRTQTSEDRFRFYQTNEPESKQVDFLSEESVVEFIRPYLAYPKTGDDSLQYQFSDESALQDPPAESICASCGLCSNEFRDLFPFNETFLERIYNPGLNEDDRRPRGLIIAVNEILEEVYYGPTAVPSSAQFLEDEVNNPDVLVSDAVLEQNETLADLARWYGTQTERDGTTYYAVDRAFTTAFDIDPIPTPETEAEGTVIAGIEYDVDTVFIPAAKDLDQTGPGQTTNKPAESGEDNEPTGTTNVDPITSEYNNLRGRVADWVNDPTNDDYAETRKYMETALKELLRYLTDEFSLWNETDLGFYIGKKSPYVYQDSITPPKPHQIVLDLDDFRASTNRSLLKYGIELWESTSPRSPEQFFNDVGEATYFSRLAEEWRSKLVSEYVTGDAVLFTKAAQNRDYSFDDFVVAAYAWLIMLDDPWQEITAEALNERYQSSDGFSLDRQLEQSFNRLPDDRQDRFSEVIEIAPYIEDILGSRLGVTRNALDVPLVRQYLRRHTPYDVIDNLAKNHINSVNSNVRFSSDDEAKLRQMALRLYDLRRTIDDDIIGLQRSVDESQVLAQLQGVSMSEVQRIHQTLTQSYAAQMPSDLKEMLDEFVSNVDQDDIDQIIDGAELIQALAGNHQQTVHRSLAELKLEEHDIMDYLRGLTGTDEEGAVTSGFAPTFREVSEYYE